MRCSIYEGANVDSRGTETAAVLRDLISRYARWSRISSIAGKRIRDDPAWEDGRLHLRVGYPHPGWTGYVLEPGEAGWAVFTVASERRDEPQESLSGFFSDVEDAGKYVVLRIGDSLRISRRMDPVVWAWETSGLDPRVRQISLDQYVSRFELKDEPSRYFVLQVGGVQPEHRLLTLSCDELDRILLDGMPESILGQL